MRKNPAFMVACVAGTVIRGLADVFRNDKEFALELKTFKQDPEEFGGSSWQLTKRGMQELFIDEMKAKEEYKDFLHGFNI